MGAGGFELLSVLVYRAVHCWVVLLSNPRMCFTLMWLLLAAHPHPTQTNPDPPAAVELRTSSRGEEPAPAPPRSAQVRGRGGIIWCTLVM